MRYYAYVDSPVGPLMLVSDGEALTGLYMNEHLRGPSAEPGWRQEAVVPIAAAATQLAEYFAGARQRFELALAPKGTEFQHAVWRALVEIPFGETTTYGEIARRIERPTAVRAVGAANGHNPISIVIPCHRLVGAHGKLIKYGGGLDRKRYLIDLEAKLRTG